MGRSSLTGRAGRSYSGGGAADDGGGGAGGSAAALLPRSSGPSLYGLGSPLRSGVCRERVPRPRRDGRLRSFIQETALKRGAHVGQAEAGQTWRGAAAQLAAGRTSGHIHRCGSRIALGAKCNTTAFGLVGRVRWARTSRPVGTVLRKCDVGIVASGGLRIA